MRQRLLIDDEQQQYLSEHFPGTYFDENKFYFKEYGLLSYSKKLDAYMMVSIKFPGTPPLNFMKDFADTIRNFDKFVEKTPKKD